MDKTTVPARLAQDNPLFHHLDEDGVRRVAAAGITDASQLLDQDVKSVDAAVA